MADIYITNAQVFDGQRLHQRASARLSDGQLQILTEAPVPASDQPIDFGGDILSPGFVDLQVNGGGGRLFNMAPTVETLEIMAAAHQSLGVRAFLPTLITDHRDATEAAIAATTAAIAQGVAGIAGLHLEGPHLDPIRKGAHDGALMRPVEDSDMARLLRAAEALPALMVTLAPEQASCAQVSRLSDAGVLVMLGHSNCTYETACAYFQAGARGATHLFNAMSQMNSRAPGLVGAVLSPPPAPVALPGHQPIAGLIADGHHVSAPMMRLALRAAGGRDRLFLVSDAMAPAGSEMTAFDLGGRRITRQEGRLTLEDGTLAGADLDLLSAVRVLTQDVGQPLEDALYAATTLPARLIERRIAQPIAHQIAPGVPEGPQPDSGPWLRIAKDLSRLCWLTPL